MILPDKLKKLKPYIPKTINYDIALDMNESFLDLPSHIREKIASAISALAFNRYPDPFAERLCSVACRYFGVEKGFCVAGNGSDELISIIISTLLPKGGKMAVYEPDFSMYKFYANLYEIEVVNSSMEADLLIFSNPCNPTGRGKKTGEVLELIRNFKGLVVVDEAYMDFWDQSILPHIGEYDNLIVLRTCSKAFGMAGIRLGFAFASKKLSDLLKMVKAPYNVSALTQAAGVVLLEEEEYLRECAESIVKSRDMLYNSLKDMGFTVENTYANFVLLDAVNAEEIHKKLLDEGISVRYIGKRLRITAGSEYENKRLTEAFERILKNGA